MLRCISPEVALLGPREMSALSPQSGPERTLSPHRQMTDRDPQPTKAPSKSRSAVGLPQCYLPLRSTGEIAGETARVIRLIFKPVKWALLALKVSNPGRV